MLAWLVVVKCRYCARVHCEAEPGCTVRFRCRKCKRLQTLTAGD